MKRLLKNLLVVLLLSITVFSAFKYVKVLKDHYRLEGELKQAKTQLSIIREEKQNLLQRIEKEKLQAEELKSRAGSFKKHLLAVKNRLEKLFSDYKNLQAQDRALNSQVAQLKEENRLL
ncbi:MAG: hypothetical protein KJ793_06170, partial [Candidatus Omnitrophica bacterium]|nr:hypothetical protein [Candidatus Omnitrophota bacterium]